MSEITKMAWRSLWQHRIRTIVAGAVLFLGSFLLLSGNSLSTALSSSMQRMVTRTLTGDIVILSDKNEERTELMDARNLETITNSFAIQKALSKVKGVKETAMMSKGFAMIDRGESSRPMPSLTIGVDQKKYKSVFPLFKLIKGSHISTGKKGIWINKEYHRMFLSSKPKIGDMIDVMVQTRNGFMNMSKVRLQGIFELEGMSTFSTFINLMDMRTYRRLFEVSVNVGMLTKAEKKVIKKNQHLFSKDLDIDSMLKDNIISKAQFKNMHYQDRNAVKRKLTPAELKIIETRNSALTEYIAVSVKTGVDTYAVIDEINKILKSRKLGAKAVHWSGTVGMIGQFIFILNVVLISLVIIIFAMLIIIIMNSLVMTALERIYEIGTMRAIGASRSFIVRLFLTESLFLGLIFGGAGALTGFLIFNNISGIPASNMMTRMLFGGAYLQVPVDIATLIRTTLIIVGFAAIASVYPSWIASRFSPIEAISEK